MAEEEKKSLPLADDKILEIQQKIAGAPKTRIAHERELFERINNSRAEDTYTFATPTAKPQVVIKNLRTFQGDVAEAMKKQNASVLSITLAEQKRKEEARNPQPVFQEKKEVGLQPSKLPITPPPAAYITSPVKERKPLIVAEHAEKKTNVIMAVTSIILVVLGISAVVGFYFIQKNATPIETIRPEERAILGYNLIKELDVTKAEKNAVIDFVNTEKNQNILAPKEIEFLSFIKSSSESKQRITTGEFLNLIETKAPPALLRSFTKSFMLGMYRDTGNELFLLIELDSFENAFNGMLEWEPKMNDDLGSLFSKRTISVIERDALTGATTSTSVAHFDSFTDETFEDETIRNKDVRILRNSRGETVFLYSFLDSKTLLITSSETTVYELGQRLISERLIR